MLLNEQLKSDFVYQYNHQTIIYSLENNDLLVNFKKIIPIVNCLNEKYDNDKFDNDRFFNLYSTRMNFRLGKSIMKTDYVLTINQHLSNHILPGKLKLNVSIADGFTTHARDSFDGFPGILKYPFEYLIFDLEYYLFLLSISDKY